MGTLGSIDIRRLQSQPLLDFREDFLEGDQILGLMESIKRHGLLHPIVVRKLSTDHTIEKGAKEETYQLVCGHRRVEACKRLGMVSIPAFIAELTDKESFEVALVENLQRQSLNAIEEAEAFKSYVVNFGRGSVTKLSRVIGKSEAYVSHRLLLLGLPEQLRKRISRRLLEPSHATELIWLGDESHQIALSEEIIKRNLTHKQTREIVRILKEEGLSIPLAVERVLQSFIGQNGIRKNHNEERNSYFDEAWHEYPQSADDAKEKDDIATLEHAILILRTCLAGLDLLAEEEDESEVRTTLMSERRVVHSALDRIVRAKVRRGRKESLLRQKISY